MISFISGVLLSEEPCWKLMLKHDIKFFFHSLQRLLKLVTSKIQYRETSKCVTIFDLNSWMSVPNIDFFQINTFISLDNAVLVLIDQPM